jgi:hypothetical protein
MNLYFVKRGHDRELLEDAGREVTGETIDEAVDKWATITGHDKGYLKKSGDKWTFWGVPVEITCTALGEPKKMNAEELNVFMKASVLVDMGGYTVVKGKELETGVYKNGDKHYVIRFIDGVPMSCTEVVSFTMPPLFHGHRYLWELKGGELCS